MSSDQEKPSPSHAEFHEAVQALDNLPNMGPVKKVLGILHRLTGGKAAEAEKAFNPETLKEEFQKGIAILEEEYTKLFKTKLEAMEAGLNTRLSNEMGEFAKNFSAEYDKKVAALKPAEADPSKPAIPNEGRLVNYVMKNGAIRPMLVVSGGDMSPNGKLFYDSTNDVGNFNGADPQNIGDGVEQMWSVPYSADKKPGTWHWPVKA